MRHFNQTGPLITLFLLSSWPALAQQPQILKERIKTVAGEIKVVQLDDGELGCKYAVLLDEQSIVKTDCEEDVGRFEGFPVPRIYKRITTAVPPFDEVIVFQQGMWGNACNGGPLWLLGLKSDGSFMISANIDHCGGPDPIVKQEGRKVIVNIPGHRPNRGAGFIPGETWVYENGEIHQAKTGSNRRRRR